MLKSVESANIRAFSICIDHENNENGVHDQKGDLP
jgi:hypothetical protein